MDTLRISTANALTKEESKRREWSFYEYKIRKPWYYLIGEYTIKNDPSTFTSELEKVKKQTFRFTRQKNSLFT